MIQLVDLKAQYNTIKPEIDNAIKEIIDTTRFIGGSPVSNFEKEFANYCGKKHGIGVSSGTSALFVALKALGIGPGDEVITTPHTFIATAEVITQIGATIRFADILEDTMLIDPSKIEPLISKKTKAIIPVHLYGQPADMKPIMEIASKHGVKVIEDCAQAHGAEQNGKKVPVGDIGCFSFYPGKNLGAYGDAGMVVTNDSKIAEDATAFINHGRAKGEKYKHSFIGANFRIDSLQAAILSVKLKKIEDWNNARRNIAQKYNDQLSNVEEVRVPFEKKGNKHVYHLYVIRTERRDALKDYLSKEGIACEIHYPVPLHLQPAYSFLGLKEGAFPVTERAAETILSIPMYPELNDGQIEFIAEKIESFS